jgi:hypothetical protein
MAKYRWPAVSSRIHRVREGEFGLAPLPPAVFKEAIEPYLAVAAGLLEGDRAGT